MDLTQPYLTFSLLAAAISVFFYLLSLVPGFLRSLFVHFRSNSAARFLLKYRRETGLLAWFFGLLHGIFIGIHSQINWLLPQTYITYFQGITLLTIFTILAFTSNKFSLKLLKKHWKTLHRLTYFAAFVLLWHIWDKKSGGWSIYTPVLLTTTALICGLLLERLVLHVVHTMNQK